MLPKLWGSTLVSVSKVAGLGFAAFSIAVLIFVFFSGVTDDGQHVNRVILEVLYGGSFNATVTVNGRERVLSGYGLFRTTLVRVGEGEWVISAVMEKLDGGNGALHVYFRMVDGEVLASDSTSEAFGVARVSLTF